MTLLACVAGLLIHGVVAAVRLWVRAGVHLPMRFWSFIWGRPWTVRRRLLAVFAPWLLAGVVAVALTFTGRASAPDVPPSGRAPIKRTVSPQRSERAATSITST